MTVQEWYNKRKGQTLLVPGQPEDLAGQCVQAADYALNEVYGLPYHYGDAIDWWYNPGELLEHFNQVTDGSIKTGDFVIFSEKVGSQFGHIDIALQDGIWSEYLGADSNWAKNKTLHQVLHIEPTWILGTLRYKGVGMVTITQAEYDDLVKWKAIGVDAQPYKNRFTTAPNWTGDANSMVVTSQEDYTDLQNWKKIGVELSQEFETIPGPVYIKKKEE